MSTTKPIDIPQRVNAHPISHISQVEIHDVTNYLDDYDEYEPPTKKQHICPTEYKKQTHTPIM